jgi:hypothetical protein
MPKKIEECPICHQMRMQKEMFVQCGYTKDHDDIVVCRETFKRRICIYCKDTRWVVHSVFQEKVVVLIEGKKESPQ